MKLPFRRLKLIVGPRRLRRGHRTRLRIKVSAPASVTVGGACKHKTKPTGVDRKRAFLHALQDQKLDDEAGLVVECATWSEDEGARAFRGLLSAPRA